MTKYPNQIDDSTSLPPASGDDANSVNASISAIEAIEGELGIVPSGVYADVRTRLDIIESRINNPFAPAPDVLNPFFIANTGVTIQAGMGDPNSILALPPPKAGSLFLREDGYVIPGLYSFGNDGYWHQVAGVGISTLQVRTITANYVVDSAGTDNVILCRATTTIVVTLPAPSVGRELVIKDVSGHAFSNNITILHNSSETIDGAPSYLISVNYAAITLIGDGSSWWVI